MLENGDESGRGTREEGVEEWGGEGRRMGAREGEGRRRMKQEKGRG